MEKIIIKNFLVFDELEMPINKFNILIGEQASGKSLLVKLVYFFKQLPIKISELMYDEYHPSYFSETIIKKFYDTFGRDINENNSGDYQIAYYYSPVIIITIIYSDSLKIGFSSKLLELFQLTGIVCEDENFGDNFKNEYEMNSSFRGQIFKNMFSDNLENSCYSINNNYTFIPANRSFYAILENNSFALLASGKVTIDEFVQDFGAKLQFYKNRNIQTNTEMQSYFDKILKGKYLRIEGKDYLTGNNYKVLLSKASSGQQEVFPLMMTLCSIPHSSKVETANNTFIEEPEAHLFPQAQNHLISAILYSMFDTHNSFFITTHSPYILSALNNSIYASELIKKDKLTTADYIEMSEGAYPLDYNDISAYSLNNGKLVDIKDQEFKMIGGDILDSVSNEFGEIMDKLIELDN